MPSDATSRLLALIADVLELDASEVKPESHLFNDLGASSLDIAEMVWRIEDDRTFGIGEIPDDVLDDIRRVKDIVDFLEGRSSVKTAKRQERYAVAIASDHAGFPLKKALTRYLEDRDIAVLDLGTKGEQSVDYPNFAKAVAERVISGEIPRGVLICGTGLGMSIAANKIPGIRAALVSEPVSARYARLHNDANILCMGSRVVGEVLAQACLDAFLDYAFDPGDDGRHRRRLDLVRALEQHPGSDGAPPDSSDA